MSAALTRSAAGFRHWADRARTVNRAITTGTNLARVTDSRRDVVGRLVHQVARIATTIRDRSSMTDADLDCSVWADRSCIEGVIDRRDRVPLISGVGHGVSVGGQSTWASGKVAVQASCETGWRVRAASTMASRGAVLRTVTVRRLPFIDLNDGSWNDERPDTDDAVEAMLAVAAREVDESWLSSWLRERVTFQG